MVLLLAFWLVNFLADICSLSLGGSEVLTLDPYLHRFHKSVPIVSQHTECYFFRGVLMERIF